MKPGGTPGRAAVIVLLLAGNAPSEGIPSPAAWLGFEPGSGGAAASPERMAGYAAAVAAASPLVRLEPVGLSTEGRMLLLILVSSPENLRGLGEVRDGLDRPVVLVTMGIHPLEIASNLAFFPLLHRLVSGASPGSARILEKSVVAFLPLNPDGADHVAAWLAERGPRAGPAPLFLQHRFAGHDLNRDWILGTQAETRAVMSSVHSRYRPWITVDLHQMGASGPRIVLPPYAGPADPEAPPELIELAGVLGTRAIEDLTRSGRKGAASRWVYDSWSPARGYPFYHGGTRILMEAASEARGGGEVAPGSLRVFGGRNEPGPDHPLPWQGGRWETREALEYLTAAVESVLVRSLEEPALSARRTYLDGPRREGAVVLREDGSDPAVLRRLIEGLRRGGARASRTRDGWLLRDPPGGIGWCRSLLLCKEYPGGRAGGEEPYDTASHDLAHMAGVEAVAAPWPAPEDGTGGAESSAAGRPSRDEPAGTAWSIPGPSIAALGAIPDLLEAGATVRRVRGATGDDGLRLAPGDLIIEGAPRAWVERLLGEGETAVPVPGGEVARWTPLRYPRIAVLHGPPSRDEGWLRWVLEEHGFRFERRRAGDLSDGEAGDAWALPSISGMPGRRVLIAAEGALEPGPAGGAARLLAEAVSGSRVISFGRSAREVARAAGLHLAEVEPAPALPGTVLRTRFAGDTKDLPLAGHARAPSVFYTGGPLWRKPGEEPAGSPWKIEPLLALGPPGPRPCGLLSPRDAALIEGAWPLVRARHAGGGEIILFGFSPHFRGWTSGTFRMLFECILAP